MALCQNSIPHQTTGEHFYHFHLVYANIISWVGHCWENPELHFCSGICRVLSLYGRQNKLLKMLLRSDLQTKTL